MEKLGAVKGLVPTADALRFLTALMDARKEEVRSRVELAKIEAARATAISQIRARADLYRQVFDRIFDERREFIEKHFEIIARGMASNDESLILNGLNGLGKIVATSPFANLASIAEVLEGDKEIEF
ncbi:hypothetical protein LVJ94_17395 [Pendulispora rubella]|uniref:Uncharacterized protein n=1 Tax=Pendulispora rubella TaxID=2741070 RepID=A0ABZ2LF44_9BACT